MDSSRAGSFPVSCAALPTAMLPLPHSQAVVQWCVGERRGVQRLSNRLFGRVLEPWEYAELAGAPDDAAVLLATLADGLYVEVHQPRTHAYHGVWLVRPLRGTCVLVNDGFHIHARTMRSHGLGLRILQRQLAIAGALGICRIETLAGRSLHENGYYSWPRYGFDGWLPETTVLRLPPMLRFARGVLDLIQHEQGRLWWRQFGGTIQVEFNLADNSRSWRVLHQYLRERASQPIPSTDSA